MALQEELEKQGAFLFKKRSYFPLFLVFLSVLFLIKRYFFSLVKDDFTSSSYYLILCLFLCISGFMIRVYAVGYSPDGTSERGTIRRTARILNKKGLYSLVRHPLYLGNFLIWTGICLLVRDIMFLIIFLLFFWIYYERIMFAEEQFLRKKFGDEYLKWAEKTPVFLPRFKGFVKPDVKLNLKKILRKEHDGFFGVIVMISFLGIAENLFGRGKTLTEDITWYIVLISGFLVYIVLKFLKKKTSVIDIN